MSPHGLQVDNLLQRVVQEVIAGDFEDEVFGASEALLPHLWVPEGSHQEEVCRELPIHLVVPLQHDRFRMRCEQPVVGAGVELVCMSDLNTIAHLDLGTIGPLVHLRFQLKVAIDGLVMEFFLLNLVASVLEGEVDPVEGVQQFHCLDEQCVVDCAVDDVLSEDALELDDQFVQRLFRHDGHELNRRGMSLKLNDTALAWGNVGRHNLIDRLDAFEGDLLAWDVCRCRVQKEDDEPSNAHHMFELVVRLLLSHSVNDLSGEGQTIPEALLISIPQTFEKELYGGGV